MPSGSGATFGGLPGWVVFLVLFTSSLVGGSAGLLLLSVLAFMVGRLMGPGA